MVQGALLARARKKIKEDTRGGTFGLEMCFSSDLDTMKQRHKVVSFS